MGRGCFLRCNNTLFLILNGGLLLSSVLILSMWVKAASGDTSSCNKLEEPPLLVIGLSLWVISLFGIIGACWRVPFLIWIYMAVSLLFVVGLSCFFLFLVLQSRSYEDGDVSLGDYSGWLQSFVKDRRLWESIRNCIRDTKACNATEQYIFHKRSTTAFKMGCCEKPKWCTPKDQKGDCSLWDDDPQVLCFACDTCKAGVLSLNQIDWEDLAQIYLHLFSFLATAYFISYFTLINIHEETDRRKIQEVLVSPFANVDSHC